MIEVGTRVRLRHGVDFDMTQYVGREATVLQVGNGDAYLAIDGADYKDYDYTTNDGVKAYLADTDEFEVIEGVPTEDEMDEEDKGTDDPDVDTMKDLWGNPLDGMTKIAPEDETIQADLSEEDIARIDRNQQRDADTARIYRLIDALGDVSVRNWELVTNNEDTIFLNVTFKRH